MLEYALTPDLWTLAAVICRSPIVVSAVPEPAPTDFADWCDRQGDNLDTAILDWLRTERPQQAAH